MKQNIQYYQYPSDVKNEPIEYDLYFIGHDHNRAAQILQIQQEAEKQGLTVKSKSSIKVPEMFLIRKFKEELPVQRRFWR